MTHPDNSFETIVEYLKRLALKNTSNKPLPSVRKLMKHFGVSQSPVCRAIQKLRQEGILCTRRGVGTLSNLGDSAHITTLSNTPVSANTPQGTVLFLYTDYPSQTIWNVATAFRKYAIQNNIALLEIKVWQDTDYLEIVRNVLAEQKIIGIVDFAQTSPLTEREIKVYRAAGIPVTIIDNLHIYKHLPRNITLLCTDGEQWGKMVIQIFAERGIRRVAFIRNEPQTSIEIQHRDSLVSAAHACGITPFVFSTAIQNWEDSAEAARRITREKAAFIREQQITGLVYVSTEGAIAGAQVIQELGLRIPQDIAILGGGNHKLAEFVYPALSTLEVDFTQMTHDALDIILGTRKRIREIKYPCTFLERRSLPPVVEKHI